MTLLMWKPGRFRMLDHYWIGVLMGFLVGTPIAVLIVALLMMAARADVKEELDLLELLREQDYR